MQIRLRILSCRTRFSLDSRLEADSILQQHASRRLFFARDPLGRRSLLIHKPSSTNSYFLLASVSIGKRPEYDLTEVSTECVYVLDLKLLGESQDVRPHPCTILWENTLRAFDPARVTLWG